MIEKIERRYNSQGFVNNASHQGTATITPAGFARPQTVRVDITGTARKMIRDAGYSIDWDYTGEQSVQIPVILNDRRVPLSIDHVFPAGDE